MTGNRIGAAASAITAAVSLIVGLAALKWYIWDVAIQQADEPDRSMLFWGIPIAFIGVAAIAVGSSLTVVAKRSFEAATTKVPPSSEL